MGDYQRLQTDAEAEIVPPIDTKIHRSFHHRAAFILSLVFTFSVVFIFLWGLPCDLDSCKPQPLSRWNKTLDGLELKGRLHLVGGHLVGIVRASLYGKQSPFHPHVGGVIALSAKTGETMWYVKLFITPIHIDCTLLGSRRCLILGEKGFLRAIDYVTGLHVWAMRSLNTTVWPQPEEIDFPLTVPGRDELITLSRFQGGHRLLFVSMKTGCVVSEPPVDSDCYHVFNLTYSNGNLYYVCTNKLGGPRIMKYTLGNSKDSSRKEPTEPVDYSKRLTEDTIHNEQQVVVNNTGSCPDTCQASIAVTDSNNTTVWSFGAERTYAMAPLSLRFRQRITGFLIKLWHWYDQAQKTSNSMTVEHIKERIVLIVFNESRLIHVVNASQTDITVLCNKGKSNCQPQLSFQTQSALLADVNGDGQQDLISYFVTYQPVNEAEHNLDKVKEWELRSNIRMVNLEAELPKLFETVSKH